MMKKQLFTFLLILFGGFSGMAQVITFDDQGHTPGQTLSNPYSIANNGEIFTFTISGGNATNHIYRTTEGSCGSSGMSHIYSGNTAQTAWTIETVSGNEFDLSTIRFDNVFGCFAFEYSLTFEGFKNNVSTGTQVFTTSGVNSIFTSNANFNDVDKVVITSSDLGNLGMDDVTWVTSVPPCTEPSVPSLTVAPNSICAGESSTLNISGILGDATNWVIYSGSCGGTQVGTTAGTTFAVSPTTTTTYFVRGEGGCTTPGSCGVVSVTVNPEDDASFSYSTSAYCINASDPTPIVSGLGGGSFSSGAGLTINASTGSIDVSVSTPGTYTVTYTTTGICPNSSNVNVTINALDDASFSYSTSAYCVDDSDPTPTISGLGGGSFSSGGGLSINASNGSIDVSASTPGTYNVVYTTTGSCPNSSSFSVTINALDNSSFGYSTGAYCIDGTDPTPTVFGVGGGSFSSGAGLVINASTGSIDVSVSTPGTYTVTYTTTTGICPNSSSVSVTINALDDASFSYSNASYCSNATDPSPTVFGIGGGLFSSSAGLSINASTGVVDVSTSLPGTYTITYTTNGLCPNSSSVNVTINGLDDASFNYSTSSFCSAATDPTPTVTGLGGGSFSSTAGLSINSSTGIVDLSASTAGTYTITYTTSGTCPNSSIVSLTVTGLDDASFNYSASTYCSNGTDPTPTISGVTGGTFSSTAGLLINASTGEIDLSASSTGTYTVTYTTVGSCSNSSTTSVTVNSIPATPSPVTPLVVCPGSDVILSATGSGTGNIVFYDNSMTQQGSVAMPPVTAIFNAGALTNGAYTFFVAESNGGCQSSLATINVVVGDVIDPIAVCQDIAIFLNNAGSASIVASDIDGGSSDNCGAVTLSASQTSFDCSSLLGVPVTLTVTDASGNTATCVANVSVSDTISPVLTCSSGIQNISDDGTGDCTFTPFAAGQGGGYVFTDNCSSALTVQEVFTGALNATSNWSLVPGTYTPVQAFPVGVTTVTVTVTDDSGNSATSSYTTTINDDEASNAVCQDVMIFLNGSGTASIAAADIDNGSSDNCSAVTLAVSLTSFTCADVGANSVTLLVTDASGNTSNCTSTVTVSDSTSPIASCQDITIFLNGSGTASIVATDIDNGSSDNCGISSMSVSSTSFTCADVGTNSVTLLVTDASGNTSECTSTVTVSDTISPIASCQDVTIFLNGSGTASIIATDIDNGSSDNCGIASMSASMTSFTCANVGPNAVTLIVTDISGNVSTCTSTVTVHDSTSPIASCQDITIFLDGSGTASIVAADIDNGSSDNCSIGSTFISTTSFTCANVGVNTVTLLVTDASGNTSECTSTVTVSDTTSPVITCPGDQTEMASASCDFVLPDYTSLVVSSDNCGGTTLTQSPLSGTLIGGDQVITMTSTDASGNVSTCTFSVLLTGATPPVAVCQDVTVYLDGSGNASIVVADIDGGSSGTCGSITLNASATMFTCAELGANNVTLTVTDGGGNTDNCTAIVTVLDTIVPIPDVALLADVTADCELTVLVDPTATDNCGTVTVSNNATLPISTMGTTVVTWMFDDGNGNISTQLQNVVIIDEASPIPMNAPLPDVIGECSVDVMPTAPFAIDACTGSITGVMTSAVTFPVTTQGTTVIIWTFDDGNGNIATQSQNIIVNDVTEPTPDAGLLTDLTGDCSIEAPTAPTATDNCTIGTITGTTSTVFPITANGMITIVWEFDDGNGNISTQTQNATNSGVDATATLSSDGGTITANNAGGTYEWLDCDLNTLIAGETGQSFIPSSNGNYAVIVTVGNCSDTSACENVSTAGIDVLGMNPILVYPNPSKDGYFTVNFDGIINAIDVVDMLGRVIVLPTNLLTGTVDGSELAYGRYMVRVTTDKTVLMTEIVIAR